MIRNVFGVLILLLAVAIGFAEDTPPTRGGANKAAAIEATLLVEKDDIRKAIGDDLDGEYIVMMVKITPKGGEALPLFLEDFTLFSEKNGERSWPYTAEQIASGTALVLGQSGGGAGVMSDSRGPVWGGLGGGRPSRMGGDGNTFGNAGGSATLTSEVKQGKAQESRLDALSSHELKEGRTEKPVSGYLFFPMNEKHKAKQIKLFYKTPAGKIALEFK